MLIPELWLTKDISGFEMNRQHHADALDQGRPHLRGVPYGELRCLELMTGKRVWETHAATTGKSARWGNAFLIPHAESDRVFLFNEKRRADHRPADAEGLRGDRPGQDAGADEQVRGGPHVVWSHPAFANGNVYVRNDKEIVAVSLKK